MKQTIIDFDKQYNSALVSLCDTLINRTGRNTSYVALIPGQETYIKFLAIDGYGKSGDYFYRNIVFTDTQISMMKNIRSATLNYDNKSGMFFMHLNSLKQGDSIVSVYINSENIDIKFLTDAIYHNDKVYYKVKGKGY